MHRIYPAPSPVAPPLNSGSGWGGDGAEAAPRMGSRASPDEVKRKSGEPSPDSSWEEVQRDENNKSRIGDEQHDRKAISNPKGRDLPPHLTPSSNGSPHSPGPETNGANRSPPPTGGAYITWQPVQ